MLQSLLQWPKYTALSDEGQYMRFQTPENHVSSCLYSYT